MKRRGIKMKTPCPSIRLLLGLIIAIASLPLSSPARKKGPEPVLTDRGKFLEKEYSDQLDAISKEISTALPVIDAQKKEAFEAARAELGALKAPRENDPEAVHKAYHMAKPLAEAKALDSARPLIADSEKLLGGDDLDGKLMKGAILRHGTPAGLAEFAQQSDENKALLDKLFADEPLMKQVLTSGGANGGEYGEAMQVYHAILEASELARKQGILQRLALGTAIHQPWLDENNKGSVNGIVFTDHRTPDGQVARYQHYERAYLAKELDPQFKDFNAWECRFITNDPYTNEELTWVRSMLRQFRPDHITNPDQKWRYTRVVKSDLPYCSTRHDDSLGMPQQQALALGGICGRRAFFGRFVTRAFGIPARRSTQTGHAAMNRWTPDGWVVNFGAWWSMNWCGPQGGLDFYLDSRAREFEEDYLQVLRAQWIGDALGQEDVSLRQYAQGGGFWDGLAFYIKRAVVEDANLEQEAADAELATLSAEEARLLGESDEVLGDGEIQEIEIPEEDKKIIIAGDGTMTVPAVACTGPRNNTDKVVFLDSWDGGMQIHYQRLGNRPELLKYTVEAPAAGKYEMTMKVCTVSKPAPVIARLNRRTLVNKTLPYTKGDWQRTEAEVIELREGRNTIQLTFRAPNRGVSIKDFELKPVK
ncbi:MAG: hypothetical protein CMI26_10940 [Opitutae bacterium]|nr:hypothetical protein [Opitutae bacterium]|tara:strand:- start:2444 stop:4387 length:1944 start_codon:yes stop_codon:yes gene_type:complete